MYTICVKVDLEHPCYISSKHETPCTVTIPDKTLRRELKIRRAAEYFDELTSGCFFWG